MSSQGKVNPQPPKKEPKSQRIARTTPKNVLNNSRALPSKARVLRQIAPGSSARSSAKSLLHKFSWGWGTFCCPSVLQGKDLSELRQKKEVLAVPVLLSILVHAVQGSLAPRGAKSLEIVSGQVLGDQRIQSRLCQSLCGCSDECQGSQKSRISSSACSPHMPLSHDRKTTPMTATGMLTILHKTVSVGE